MPNIVNIKIKQFEDRVATSGIFMGGDRCRRKLEPGEVVGIPPELEDDGGLNILDTLLATERVEITRDKATRPLDYASAQEAKFCAPGFRPHDDSEARLAEAARENVAARLRAEEDTRKKADKAAQKERKANKTPAAVTRRQARRAAREKLPGLQSDGAQDTAG